MWYRPSALEEALVLLTSAKATVVAGGTDLFVGRGRQRLSEGDPERAFVTVAHLPELRTIRLEEDALILGAAVRAADILRHPLLGETVLGEAARLVGGVEIQNRATVGGNVVHASPAADMSLALFALEAEVVVRSRDGERRLLVADFVRGPGEVALLPGEMVVAFRLPRARLIGRHIFRRLAIRRGSDISLVAVAACRQEGAGRPTLKVAVGAAHPHPLTLPEAEALFLEDPSEAQAARVAARYEEAVRPIDDVRASALYRRRMVGVLVRRVLLDLLRADGATEDLAAKHRAMEGGDAL